MMINGGHHIGYESDELEVAHRSLGRSEEQSAGIGAETPVVVLARTVDAGERLLVEEHTEIVSACHLSYKRHKQHVVVVGKVGLLKYRSKLKLVGSHLIMTRLGRDAEAVALYLKVKHECLNS